MPTTSDFDYETWLATASSKRGPHPKLAIHPRLDLILEWAARFDEAKRNGETEVGWQVWCDEVLFERFGVRLSPGNLRRFLLKRGVVETR